MKKETSGPQKLIVIPVQFPDKLATTTISDIKHRVYEEMDSYFRNVSYNKITIIGNTSEAWVLLPQNLNYYGDFDGKNDHTGGSRSLIYDAIGCCDDFVDFSLYDCILVVHSGENEVNSQKIEDLWSWGFWEGLSAQTNDGVTFDQGAIVSEFDSLGTFCHEYGHILGLPDLYTYDESSSEFLVGRFGLMCHGSHNGNPEGSKPSHILSWGKIFLNWIDESQVIEVSLDQTINVTLEPIETQNFGMKVIKIPISAKEYYLLEVRNDNDLPQQGVLITKVNETKNSGEGIVTRAQSNRYDAALNIGGVYEETENWFSVRVLDQFANLSCLVQVSNKLVPKIRILEPRKVKAWKNFNIQVKITNYEGSTLQGMITNLSIEGQMITNITDINGISTFSFCFNPLALGERSINIQVVGNEYYMNNQASATIEVTFSTTLLILIFILSMISGIIIISYIHFRQP